MSNRSVVIIVDLDGTLSDCSHRVHYVEREDKKWHEFHSSCKDDVINNWCLTIINAMNVRGIQTILLTGRDEKYRQVTLEWLDDHHVPFTELYMRGDQDRRPDSEVKSDVHDIIKDKYDVLFVIEDRKSVVEMWRQKGVTCLQCDWGDF
jgi:histidinol phosphatase-like enzyme